MILMYEYSYPNNTHVDGAKYGWKTMTSLLSSQGLCIGQRMVGESLQRTNPGYHHGHRLDGMYYPALAYPPYPILRDTLLHTIAQSQPLHPGFKTQH